MDLFSNIPSWISVVPAAFSALFAGISWYQSNGSKKAKAKAEERARQAEELLEQMSDIASSLREPVLELIKEPGKCNYTLRNNTESSIKILEALNHKSFYYDVYSDELAEIPKEVHPGKPIDLPLPHTASVRSLDLRIEINGEEKILYVEIPR